MSLARQRLEGTTIGFVIGAVAGYAVLFAFLLIDLANPNFEAIYETTRPHGLLATLWFNAGDWSLYVLTGLIGALVGLATGRGLLILRLLAIPILALVGSGLLGSAWVNRDVNEQPYAFLVMMNALAGLACLASAAWIAFQARPSRVR